MLNIRKIEKESLKNCWTIKFSLPREIYLIPFSHSEIAIIKKEIVTELEFIKLIKYLFDLINIFNEMDPKNTEELPDLKDLDIENKLDKFIFDVDSYLNITVPFNSIEVYEYDDMGNRYLLEFNN